MNCQADVELTTEDGIVLWIKDNMVTSIWSDNGSTLIPLSVYEEFGLDGVRGKKFCSMCFAEVVSERPHRHFAGLYCDVCWETYKKENSRKCLICGRPEWSCTC